VRELERIAEMGVLQPVARIVHATSSPLGLPPSPALAEQARQALPGPLGVLESVLSDGRPFLAGERPTIADCTLQAALQFARFRKVEIDPALEQLARWDRAYRERAPAKAVLVV
jgi:glutathione S-transferase